MDLHFTSFMFGLVTGSGVCLIIRWLQNPKLKLREKSTDDCFLFHPQKYTIQCAKDSSICEELSCSACNFKKFMNVIKSTKTHLDICMYVITAEAVTSVILDLFSKGVYVRIIVDKQMSDEAQNSKVLVFLKEHIPIKIIDYGEIMHNKFVVIDKKKVLTGSFNWTRQAMQGNFENMVVLHDSEIVKKFEQYFQDIWLTPSKTR